MACSCCTYRYLKVKIDAVKLRIGMYNGQDIKGLIFDTNFRKKIIYLFNSHRTRRSWYKVNFSAEFKRFEFRAFILLDQFPYQG